MSRAALLARGLARVRAHALAHAALPERVAARMPAAGAPVAAPQQPRLARPMHRAPASI